MKQTSGIDALLEALRQSGVNVDGRFDADAEAPSDGAGRAGRGGGGGSQPPHVHVEVPFADVYKRQRKDPVNLYCSLTLVVGSARRG